jgi:hypothetical protein
VLIKKLCYRVPLVGREETVLPYLHDIYQIGQSLFELCNSEAHRVGLLKRKLEIEKGDEFGSVSELANMIEVQFTVSQKLFGLLMHFARRYTNDSYNITLYLNMARIQKAEHELNELLEETRKFLKEVTWIWISNQFWVVWCVKVMLSRIRKKIAFNEKMRKKAAEAKALLDQGIVPV